MMVGYTHDSKTLWRLWVAEFQRVKAQSEVVFDEERNAHMSCQHESNEIDIFEIPEDEKYVKETDTGDEPLRDSQPTQKGGQPTQIGSQPTQIGNRSKSHMHKASDEEAENAQSRRFRREDQTAQRSAANAENIAHSLHLCREDQTPQRSAAAIKKSSQVPRAAPVPAPAPPIGSRVTRRQGKVSAEALTASTTDPFTYAEAMEGPQ